jgi:hypothetical protein
VSCVPVEVLVVCTTRARVLEFCVNQEVRIGSAWAVDERAKRRLMTRMGRCFITVVNCMSL